MIFAPTMLKLKLIITFWEGKRTKTSAQNAANNRICGLCLSHATPDSTFSHLSSLGWGRIVVTVNTSVLYRLQVWQGVLESLSDPQEKQKVDLELI